MICCVLDTSAILQRFQPTSLNAAYFIDTLYKNKKIELDLPIVCIPETIQQFYNSHRKSQFSGAAMSIVERQGLIGRFKKDIKDGLLVKYPAPDSLFARAEEIYNVSFTISPMGAEPINMADMLVIATALEMKSIPKKYVEEVYLFSSDPHLLDVANRLGIISYDPKFINIDRLPRCFCRRVYMRRRARLKVTCRHCKDGSQYGPTYTRNICNHGLCIDMPVRKINQREKISLRIMHYRNPATVIDRNAVAVWIKNSRVGFKLEKQIDAASLLS